MTEQFFNEPILTLGVSCGSGDTSLTLGGAGVGALPTSGTYRLLVDAEIMIVTSRSGSVVQVTRGAEGTVATGHTAGGSTPASVTTSFTAGALLQLIADLAAGRGGTAATMSYGGTPSLTVLSTDRSILVNSSAWIAQGAMVATLPATPMVDERHSFNEDGWIIGRPAWRVSGNGNPIQPYAQNVQTSQPRGELGGGTITAVADLGAQAAWVWTGALWVRD